MGEMTLVLRMKSDGTATVSGDLDRLAGGMRKLDGDAKKSRFSIRELAGAIASLYIVKEIAQEIWGASTRFEGYDTALKAATGSSQAAKAEMSYVLAEAKRLKLDIDVLAGSYAQLAASARGTSLEGTETRKIFSAVAEAARVMNLSAEESKGALTAISQMMSKGKVSAEELRGQLGERLPGAFQMAARAMGVSTAELDKMLVTGQIMAEDMLPRLADEIRASVAEGLPEAVNSSSAAFTDLTNELKLLAKTAGDTGLMEGATMGIRLLTDLAGKGKAALGEVRVIALASAASIQKGWAQMEAVGKVTWEGIKAIAGMALQAIKNRVADVVAGYAAILDLFGADKTAAKLRAWSDGFRDNSDVMAEHLKVATRVRKEMEAKIRAIDAGTEALIDEYREQQKSTEVAKEAAEATKAETEEVKALTKGQEKLLDTLDPLRKISREYEEDLRALEGAYRDHLITTEEYDAAVDALNANLEKEVNALDGVKKKTEETTSVVKEHAAEVGGPMVKAYEDAASGIRGSFVSFFEGIFDRGVDSFSDLKDSVLDIFKKMLAEMATLAIARPIMLPLISGLGGALGVPGLAQAGVLEQLGLGGAGAGSAIGGMLSGLFGGGAPSSEIDALDAFYSADAGSGSGLLGSAMALGGPLFTNPWLLGAAAVGGLAYSFWPGKDEWNDPDLTIKDYGRAGESWNFDGLLKGPGEREAFRSGFNTFVDSWNTLWTSWGGDIEKDFGELFVDNPEDTADLFGQLANKYVRRASGGSFDFADWAKPGESLDETINRVMGSFAAIQGYMDTDVFDHYAEAVAGANRTVFGAWQDSVDGVNEILGSWTGSADEVDDLAIAVQDLRQNELVLLAQLDSYVKSITGMFESSSERIMLDTMTDDQKYNYYMNQAIGGQVQIANAGMFGLTPDQVYELTTGFNRDLMNAWNLLSPEDQQAQKDYFLGLLGDTEGDSKGFLQGIMGDVGDISGTITTSIDTAMQIVAAKFTEAADKQLVAADRMDQATSRPIVVELTAAERSELGYE